MHSKEQKHTDHTTYALDKEVVSSQCLTFDQYKEQLVFLPGCMGFSEP